MDKHLPCQIVAREILVNVTKFGGFSLLMTKAIKVQNQCGHNQPPGLNRVKIRPSAVQNDIFSASAVFNYTFWLGLVKINFYGYEIDLISTIKSSHFLIKVRVFAFFL